MSGHMEEKEITMSDKSGYYVGYLASYSVFTIVLFFVLRFLHRIPTDWTVVQVAGITLTLHIIGHCIKRLLK